MLKLNTISRILSISAIIICFVIGVVMIVLGGFAPLFAIAAGILLLYYAIILTVLLVIRKRKTPKTVAFLLFGLVLIPMIWALIDPHGLIEFVMPNFHLDMR